MFIGRIYGPRANKVNSCNCELAAKSPHIKVESQQKTNKPWSRLHLDYTGPIIGILLPYSGRQLHEMTM